MSLNEWARREVMNHDEWRCTLRRNVERSWAANEGTRLHVTGSRFTGTALGIARNAK
jgi:hypothetical protein